MGGRGGSQELAASTGRATGSTARFGGFFERDFAVGEASSDGLDFTRVFALGGWQGDSAGDDDAGEIVLRGEGHHHGGEAFVAGGDADDPFASWQRSDQTFQHDGGVVAIGEAIHHADGPLRAAIAGIANVRCERQGFESIEFFGGGSHEQADFVVAGVIAQGNRLAVFAANPALGAEDQVLVSQQLPGVPAHAGVLGEPE
ncbi:MAG: YjhG yagF: putative dehydratase, YjhG/YagF [Schlesneria sp.]|nr:YjhG yagF: putative dehydratase, YjhG/YagF [Schlesneria sp.]